MRPAARGGTVATEREKITAQTAPSSPAHETAANALESFREREGIALVDWDKRAPAPRLRIVGVAV